MLKTVGVDIGGTNIKIVQVAEKGEVLKAFSLPTPAGPDGGPDAITNTLISTLKKDAIAGAAGAGFGIAGVIDRKRGVVIDSPNIRSLNGLPARDLFHRELSIPVVIDNDANTYAYGEKWVGAGRPFSSFLLLTLGTGLGGGLIYRGALFEGHMEVGHMIIEPHGRSCTCGRRGCLESYASGRAITDRAIASLEGGTRSILTECCNGNYYKITPELVYTSALDGDNLSRELFREAGQYLGMGVANLVNLFSLEAVILGGGLLGAWDLFIEELKEEFSRRVMKPLAESVSIHKAALKNDGGSIGAAGLALNAVRNSSSSASISPHGLS